MKFPDIFAHVVKIATKIPRPIALKLTRIVIMDEINNSSPQPVSPKINKSNLSIKKEAAKAASYINHFFNKLHRDITTEPLFCNF